MPIRIPDALPATEVLESENIFVMTEHRAIHQDIRPLRVLILNLMPLKIETETQILRKLSNTPLQVEVDLLQTVTHKATHVPPKHMESFYVDLDDIRNKRYDGMIVTGAPVESSPLKMWTTGLNCATSSNGQKPMYSQLCTSAGARRRVPTIISGFQSI